ncbi:MAG: hypothetical protein LBG29_02695 [Synergistaceae bacterium]|nr:hypothetical protein [Synergistaceae bacterium]
MPSRRPWLWRSDAQCCHEGHGGNILAKSRFIPASKLYERLLARRLLIRRCANFRGLDDSFFKIAVRGAGDNDELLCALSEIA